MFDVKSQKAPARTVSMKCKRNVESNTIMCISYRANSLKKLLGSFGCRRSVVDEAEAVFSLVDVR